MRALEQLEIYLNGSYSKDEKGAFLLRSRCICNFWEHEISQLRIKSDYNRINVYVNSKDSQEFVRPLRGTTFLAVHINYDISEATKDDVDEPNSQMVYMGIISKAIQNVSLFMSVPIAENERILTKFKDNGFKNEWIQDIREISKKNIVCTIKAQLTQSSFLLVQHIERNGNETHEQLIVSTKPREYSFNDFLGSLVLKKNQFLEYRVGKSVLSTYDLNDDTLTIL